MDPSRAAAAVVLTLLFVGTACGTPTGASDPAVTCQTGLSNCNGTCVDTSTDVDNCASCGTVCPAGDSCVGGHCTGCQSGRTSCQTGDGTACVDVTSDPMNCNGCGHVCPSGSCVAGACVQYHAESLSVPWIVSCADGTTDCGGLCVDENLDDNNCGACGTTCGSGNVCSNAHCCPTSTPFYCGGCDTLDNCALKSSRLIVAGENHTCAINAAGAVFCWGENALGELGDGTYTNSNTAVAVPSLSSGVRSLEATGWKTCAVDSSNNGYCWGAGAHGELGDGSFSGANTPQKLSSVSGQVAAIVGGGGFGYATCILLTSGAVDCMGADQDEGVLCQGSTSEDELDVPTSTVISSATGLFGNNDNVMCATNSGSLACWGKVFGTIADLGDGSTQVSGSPITVKGVSGAIQASLGGGHQCVVSTGGVLQCMGDNYDGQCGDGTSDSPNTKAMTTATLSNVLSVAAGGDFTCALTTSGAVYCIGGDPLGELGNGTTTTLPTTTWQLVIRSGVMALGAGGEHACATLASGQAECWGLNFSGQLGDGTNTNRSTPQVVVGF